MITQSAVRASRTPWLLAGALLVASAGSPRPAAGQAKACARTAPALWSVSGIVASGSTLGSCTANTAWSRVAPLALSDAGAATGNAAAAGTISLTRFSDHLFVGIAVGGDDDFSEFDNVVLVFDKENDNSANDGDFFLRILVGPAAAVESPGGGTNCNQAATVEYYRFSAADGGFIKENTAGVATATTARAAYDYETGGDAETKLWNLEVDMPIGKVVGATTYYGLGTSGDFFGMGAYAFVDKGHFQVGQTGKVLKWPSGLVDRQISQWDQNAPAWNPTQLADVSLADACFNVTFATVTTPWEINDQPAAAGDHRLNPPSQQNKFKVRFFYDGPGDAVASGSNTGEVKLALTPYTASGTKPAWTPPSPSYVAEQFNMNHAVEFTAPANTFPSDLNFVCASLLLQNFQRDDDPSLSDNKKTINHNYIRTSEYTQEIVLSADSIPNLAPGQATTLVLNLTTTNDPGSRRIGLGPGGGPYPRSALAMIGVGVVLTGAAGAVRRRRGAALLLLLAGAAALISGCRGVPGLPGPGGEQIGTERWQVENARELGLTPIRGEPGWYRMPIRQGEDRRMRLRFVGRPLPYRTAEYRLAMRSEGEPQVTRIPVRQGRVVSVIAFGEVDVDGPDGPAAPTTAAGFVRGDGVGRAARVEGYPLARSRYIPSQNVGALIGSFDGFRTSFVIGTNASFAVPRGAEQLSLAINGLPADYRAALGEFLVNVIDTPAPAVPTVAPVAFDTPYDRPSFIVPWHVLTSTHVYSFYETPVVEAGSRRAQVGRVALNEAHVSVYQSHAQ